MSNNLIQQIIDPNFDLTVCGLMSASSVQKYGVLQEYILRVVLFFIFVNDFFLEI